MTYALFKIYVTSIVLKKNFQIYTTPLLHQVQYITTIYIYIAYEIIPTFKGEKYLINIVISQHIESDLLDWVYLPH